MLLRQGSSETKRTTVILAVMSLSLLITDTCPSVLGLYMHFSGGDAFLKQKQAFELLFITNSIINFITYSTMSKKFRQTFIRLFMPRYVRDHSDISLSRGCSNISLSQVEQTPPIP